jgi:hypothetical protein
MSVYKLPYWDDSDTFFTQENNPSEILLKKILGRIYLESCGPTAVANIVQSLDKYLRVIISSKKFGNVDYVIPLDETIMDYFGNTDNFKRFDEIRESEGFKKKPFNEIPQYYPEMVNDLFDMKGVFRWGVSFTKVAEYVAKGYGVMLCFKKPGHFIAVGYADDVSEEIEYRDSWKNNYFPKRLKGTSGFNRRVKWSEIEGNLQGYLVAIGEKE